MRYDLFLSMRLNISKNKAKELIESEQVLLNNKLFKPSFNVKNYLLSLDKNANLNEIANSALLKTELLEKIYFSRAAFKLKAFLNQISLNIKDKICLDIGASSGGFVQVLLEKGAKKVIALDVGKNQLHQSLKENKAVESVENTDLRAYKSEMKFDLITCDVSFISLLSLIFYIKELAKSDIILLFKPQFEVGMNAKRNKKGVLMNEKDIIKAQMSFEKECAKLGLILQTKANSALKGKEGNVEFFYHFKRD